MHNLIESIAHEHADEWIRLIMQVSGVDNVVEDVVKWAVVVFCEKSHLFVYSWYETEGHDETDRRRMARAALRFLDMHQQLRDELPIQEKERVRLVLLLESCVM